MMLLKKARQHARHAIHITPVVAAAIVVCLVTFHLYFFDAVSGYDDAARRWLAVILMVAGVGSLPYLLDMALGRILRRISALLCFVFAVSLLSFAAQYQIAIIATHADGLLWLYEDGVLLWSVVVFAVLMVLFGVVSRHHQYS